MLDRFELTIRSSDLPVSDKGNVVMPATNRYYAAVRAGRGGRAMIARTAVAKSFIRRLGGLLIRKGHDCSPQFPLISEGSWRFTLVQFAPRRRGKSNLPLLDSDATLKSVKDALQATGVLSDDMLVLEDRTVALYRKADPGLWILLERLTDDEVAGLRDKFLGQQTLVA